MFLDYGGDASPGGGRHVGGVTEKQDPSHVTATWEGSFCFRPGPQSFPSPNCRPSQSTASASLSCDSLT
jgi:hypothetical protein